MCRRSPSLAGSRHRFRGCACVLPESSGRSRPQLASSTLPWYLSVSVAPFPRAFSFFVFDFWTRNRNLRIRDVENFFVSRFLELSSARAARSHVPQVAPSPRRQPPQAAAVNLDLLIRQKKRPRPPRPYDAYERSMSFRVISTLVEASH